MSAKDAQHLLQEIRDAEDVLEKNRQMGVEKQERVEELQMQHNKWACVFGDGWMDGTLKMTSLIWFTYRCTCIIRVCWGISSAKCWSHPTITNHRGQIPMSVIMYLLDAESVIQSIYLFLSPGVWLWLTMSVDKWMISCGDWWLSFLMPPPWPQ